jgi:hypothetical protein
MAGDLSLRSPALGAKGRRLAVMAPPAGHRRYCGPRGAHATGCDRPSPPAGGHRGRHAARGQRPDGHWRQGQGAGGHPASHPNSSIAPLSLCSGFLLGLAMFLHNSYIEHEFAIIHLGEKNLCPVITSLCIQVSGSCCSTFKLC